MALVLSSAYVLFSFHALAALPRKIPLRVNVLLALAFAFVNINQFTILTLNFKLFTVDPEIPKFLAAVLQRDFTMTLGVLIFVNAFLTERRIARKAGIAAAALLFLLLTNQTLFWTGTFRYRHWNIGYDALAIATLMAVAYGMAKGFLAIDRREESAHAR